MTEAKSADTNPATDRQRAVDRYFRAANVGTVALVVFVVVDSIDTMAGPINFGGAAAFLILFMMIVFLWAMYHLFRHRHADEFTLALWHSGVTAAFIMLIFWALFGNVIAGTIWGLTSDVHTEQSPQMQFVDYWTAPICIAAFFCAFQYKRFKGAY